MKFNENIVVHLNRLLSDELVAMNQFFLHSKIFKNLGLDRLNNIEYKEYMDELEHADLYVNRILFLEGMPSLRNCNELNISKNIEDILRMDLKLEYTSISNLRDSIKYADSIQDYVSKEIMINILQEEENHVDFLETELSLMTKIGMNNYIQSQLRE